MTAAAGDAFTAESIDLAWQEQDGGQSVAASCWFEHEPIRHAVRKHVAGSEPWDRIIDQRVVDRLRASGDRPSAADCREFVQAIARQMQACCSLPRLCRFQEAAIPAADDVRPAAARLHDPHAVEKILFVFPSGGVAFVRVERPRFDDLTVTVFLTTFLPRHVGWVAPARAAAKTAARYVQRWAPDYHATGGRLLPDPDSTVPETDEVDERALHRRWFRFISMKTWGFRRQKDGRWAWIDPNPAG